MNNYRKVLLVNLILIIVLLGGGFAGYYYYYQSTTYLSTDNAQVSGQPINIVAPANGVLSDWSGDVGKPFTAGENVGTITVPAATAGAKPTQVSVPIPTNGTIVQDNAVKNQFVAAGTPLAEAFDMSNLWITANIKETDINDVKVGQDVDVYVDAFPGNTLSGHVDKIGMATANTFSLLPSSNTTGNYTKVTQVVPVTIKLDNYKGLALAPGMSVTVRIHK
jgi:multidrug resistance efflux pump